MTDRPSIFTPYQLALIALLNQNERQLDRLDRLEARLRERAARDARGVVEVARFMPKGPA